LQGKVLLHFVDVLWRQQLITDLIIAPANGAAHSFSNRLIQEGRHQNTLSQKSL
jgi:hypothetical protein